MYKFDKMPTKQFGLAYEPCLRGHGMDEDGPGISFGIQMTNPYGFQAIDRAALKEEILRMGGGLRAILEIGVGVERFDEISSGSSQVIMANKRPECVYLGVDIDTSDRCGWVCANPNSHFLSADSADFTAVESALREVGIKEIDMLLIDGWHSVNKVLAEWRYVRLLSDHGVVVMHDISAHPSGVVFDAIDEDIFKKIKYESGSSWGLGIARRISNTDHNT